MIVYRLIPNITQLENSLNSFAGVLDADEVLLFERATFLVNSCSLPRDILVVILVCLSLMVECNNCIKINNFIINDNYN